MRNALQILVYGLTFLTLLGCSGIAVAQSFSFPQALDHYSNVDGLSQGMVTCIHQDRKGFLWFGTKDGLNRFNGYSFKVFYHDGFDSTSISSNFIEVIFEDQFGYLWIGTDQGLNRYDPKRECFMRFYNNPQNEQSLSSDLITAITETADSNGQQRLWVGTPKGLNQLVLQWETDANTAQQKLSRFKVFHHFLAAQDLANAATNHIQNLAVAPDGRLWVSTPLGVYRKLKLGADPRETAFQALNKGDKPSMLPTIDYCNFLTDKDGNFWVGTQRSLSKLTSTSEPPQFEHFYLPQNTFAEIKAFTQDSKGSIWVILNAGNPYLFHPESQTFELFGEKFNFDPAQLAPLLISVHCDRSDNVWLGTSGFGLLKYNLKKDFFHVVTRSSVPENPPNTSYVSTFVPTPNNKVLVGMDRFLEYAPSINQLQSPDLPFLKDKNVEFKALSDGLYFIHKWELKEYWLYNSNTGQFQLIEKASSNRAIELYSVIQDNNGNIYAIEFEVAQSIEDGTLYFKQWQIKNKSKTEWPLPQASDLPVYRNFLHGVMDSSGIIWYPSQQGLHRIDPVKKTSKHYSHDPTNAKSLNHNYIKSVCLDPVFPNRYLWVGTSGGGINRLDRQTDHFIHYVEKDGLPNSVVYGILPDQKGNLWLSTNQGLSQMVLNEQREAAQFSNYDTRDGLPGNEFNTSAFYKHPSGTLYFGGTDGFVWFHPDSMTHNSSPPPVVITDLQINYQSVDHKTTNSPLKQSITTTESVLLQYQQNALTFEFAALDFSNPSKNQYAYKLENFDQDWRMAGTNTRAIYTNLDPGKYIFRVKASNEDKVWNEAGAEVKIVILPPWWQTWWAFTAFTALIIGLLWAMRRFRLERRQLRQQAAIEKARAEEKRHQAENIQAHALELEAAFKELKEKNAAIISAQQKLIVQDKLATLGQLSAGIAHEIKNPLNFVNNFSEVALELIDELQEELDQLKPAIAPSALETIQELITEIRANTEDVFNSGQRATSIVRSMMDHARNTEDKRQHVNINELLDTNIQLAYHGFRAINPSFNLNIQKAYDPQLPELPMIAHSMGRVLLNILNNACYAIYEKQKIANNGYQPNLKVATVNKGEKIQIQISDNGPGIPAEVIDKIFTPFFTTKPSGSGNTGLGLSISREIVEEKHGGQLEVKSQAGEYTTFIISLPLKP